MDGLFDLDPADTGILFDVDALSEGTTLGIVSIGAAHQSVTFQPLTGGSLRIGELFCPGPLPHTLWVICDGNEQVVVSTETFHQIRYTPPRPQQNGGQ